LIEISEVYDERSDKQLVFLDSELNPVVVRKIEKVPFKGKIYAVTVKNHIILVRHGNSTPIWCGNECDETGYVVSKVLTNVAVDDCNWQTDSAGTPSSNTCPNIDLTLGTTAGKYLYQETSSGWCMGSGLEAKNDGGNGDEREEP